MFKKKEQKKEKALSTKFTVVFWLIVILLVFVGVALYVSLMPFNIHSFNFWFVIDVAVSAICFIAIIVKSGTNIFHKQKIFDKAEKRLLLAIIFCNVLLVIGSFIGTPLLGGLNDYKNRMEPITSDLTILDEFDESQVQIIDKDSATSLGDRVFGELGSETVSQFDVSDNYASVVVNGTMYRLTPVEYSGFVKWISTRKNGIPGYISVNVTTGEALFHKVSSGMKYSPGAYLNEDLYRHIYFKYPTLILGNSKFEVDDNWNPYWVTQVLSYTWVDKAKDVKGVVITDPVTGDVQYYDADKAPAWVDNIYDAKLICDQYTDYSRYQHGLVNISKKGVTTTTEDYAYLQRNGQLYIYTGITSVGNDESNVGFIYASLHSKEILYFVSAGAEEFSARASAEGAVQEKRYNSIFPTMVMINGEPVYFMGLKDNAGLIKSYAFVSYKNYQTVGIGSSVQEALIAYKKAAGATTGGDSEEKAIIVADVKTAVINGNTIYYIRTEDDQYYQVSINVSDMLPFVEAGDELNVVISGSTITQIKH